MAEQIRVELNDAGIQELLKSEGVAAFLAEKAAAVQAGAASSGGEFSADLIEGKNRVRAVVRTDDYKARKAESERQALSRAGHAVGGSPGKG